MALTNETVTKDLGAVTPYALAVEAGFTGTKAEWGNYIANASNNAQAAAAEALKSEGYANGTQNGVAVGQDSEYYHKSAKYFADEAENVRQSIPQDYTSLSNNVDDLKSALYTDLPSGRTKVNIVWGNGWINSSGVYNSSDTRYICDAFQTDELIMFENKTGETAYVVYFSQFTDFTSFTFDHYSTVSNNGTHNISKDYPYIAIEVNTTNSSKLNGAYLYGESTISYLSVASINKIKGNVTQAENDIAQSEIVSHGGNLIVNSGYYIKNGQDIGAYCNVEDTVENANYSCALAEHVAKGQKFYLIGRVTGVGKLYAWLDADHKVVSNSGSTAATDGTVIECPVDDGVLVVSANTQDVDLVVTALPISDKGVCVYFSNGASPTFVQTLNGTNSTMVVNLPNAEFRLYRGDGTHIVATTAYTSQSFTVPSLQKLVYDESDETIKVISATAFNNGVYTLLGMFGESVQGLLVPYLQRWKDIRNKKHSQPIAYFSAGQNPYFQRIKKNSSTIIKVLFPNADFRIYGASGLIYNVNTYANQEFSVSVLNKLVYDISDGTVKIVQATANGEYIDLLAVNGDSISGILVPFYMENDDYFDVTETNDIYSAAFNSSAKFLFFSDIHGSEENLKRIMNKAVSWGSRIDAIINGGDTVQNSLQDGLTWYNTLVNASDEDVLFCVGNHDVWSNATNWTPASKSDVYNAVIAPMLNRVSGIVQPSGASTNNLLYYYKDYSDVRVIVLDAMKTTSSVVGWWDETELNWFEGVLEDAKENSKKVICVVHPPIKKDIAVRDELSNVNSWIDYRTSSVYEGIYLPTEAMDAVKTFITAGGTFICWLSGHLHMDNVLTATGYDGQVMINIGSARYNFRPDGNSTYTSQYSREKWYDLYDYIGIDTTNSLIKIVRFGYVMDGAMKMRKRFCYDYRNSKLITVS